jgi:pimeloyl-ACP methyl ester carboxylesterase
MSTPRSVQIPEGVTRTTVATSRGEFAALEALPVAGPCEQGPALLVPGYTGSKEDFIAVLGQLAVGGQLGRKRRVVAIDMRGQFETPGPDLDAAYDIAELGADVGAVADAIGADHLLGHSFGGLVARQTALASPLRSLTLMSSGPGGLTGPRADELRAVLGYLGDSTGDERRDKIIALWDAQLEPQAVADGVPRPVVAFLRDRMLRSSPAGLAAMARNLLAAPDKTAELAKLSELPILVIYGEQDNAWSPAMQEEMAGQLNASRVCIPGAAHSPAVEAPAFTTDSLTRFWNDAENA